MSRAVDDSGNLEDAGTRVSRVARLLPLLGLGPARDPRGRSTPGTAGAVEVGMQVHAPTRPAPSPASASTSRASNTGTPRREPLDRLRAAARPGDLQRGDGLRVAAGHASRPRCRGRPNTTYVVVLLRPGRPLPLRTTGTCTRTRPRRPDGNNSLDSPPLHVLRNAPGSGQRALQLQRDHHIPDEHLPGARTTGSMSSSGRGEGPEPHDRPHTTGPKTGPMTGPAVRRCGRRPRGWPAPAPGSWW